MAWTKEAKQKRRAEAIAKRAADDAARKIIRKPRGRQPVGKDWDPHFGQWVDRPPAPLTSSHHEAQATLDDAPASIFPGSRVATPKPHCTQGGGHRRG